VQPAGQPPDSVLSLAAPVPARLHGLGERPAVMGSLAAMLGVRKKEQRVLRPASRSPAPMSLSSIEYSNACASRVPSAL
jgi:hypothetical protein